MSDPEPSDSEPDDYEPYAGDWLAEAEAAKARDDASEEEQPDTTERRGPSIATQLVNLARARYRLGVSSEQEPFAVAHYGPNVAQLLRGSRSLRSELAKAFFADHHKAAPGSALTDALNVLEGMALEADREDVHLRVARHGPGIVLDLGTADGTAVTVEPGRWDVVPRSPVLFRRTSAMAAMPVPVAAGGELTELRELLNVSDESWPVLIGWLVAGLLPWMAHPVLLLTGEQGTAKSTAGRILGATLDPSGAQLRRAPTDPKDWLAQASASWVVCLDNISTIPAWLSDALCRAVTGDGSVDRTLYTNLDVTVTSFRRVLCLTSIDAGRIRGDLAERLLPIELERITEDKRLEDAIVTARFEAAHPAVLGGLLTLTSQVLAALPHVQPKRLPRMADFGRVLAALDEAHNHTAGDGDMWRAVLTYQDRLDDVMRAVVDDDQVGTAVVDLMASIHQWEGTATELLKALTCPDPRPKDWPGSPQALGGAVKRLAPALAAVGIDIDRPRTKRRRTIVITRRLVGEEAVTLSPRHPEAVTGDNGDDLSLPITYATDESDDAAR